MDTEDGFIPSARVTITESCTNGSLDSILKKISRVDESDTIICLDLSSGLLNEIPEEICCNPRLTSLEILNVSWNHVKRCSEFCFQRWNNLRILRLEHNKLDYVGNSIQYLTNLEQLNLSGNKELALIPEEIGNLQSLRELRLGSCSLKSLPSSLSNLTNLKSLSLQDNLITDITPILSLFGNLTVLSLRNNQIDNIPQNVLPTQISLTNLDLSDNYFESLPEDMLKKCESLLSLNISYNRIKQITFVNSISTNLKVLDLNSNQLQSLPMELFKLTTLEHLDLSYNRLDEIDIGVLQQATHLKTLDLIGNKIQKEIPRINKSLIYCTMRAPSIKDEPNFILPKLFLGNIWAAKNRAQLIERGITHILTIANDIDPPYPEDFTYHVVALEDVESANLSAHFIDCIKFIESARTSGGCLVHCAAGISRSATVTIAYIMYHNKIGLLDAYQFVKNCRRIIDPNPGFMQQLKKFDEIVTNLTI